MKRLLSAISLLIFTNCVAQDQICPINIDFFLGALTHWAAYTGNNRDGNGPTAIMVNYDSIHGTNAVTAISEYTLPSVTGIRVISSQGTDFFGGFQTIPTINGYAYSHSLLLGSTAVSRSSSAGTQGGYIRGVSYRIHVPKSTTTHPYTMTYAYAMVLENGTHNSNQQPLFSATLTTADSAILCASPRYYLPTKDNANGMGSGATLDSAIAIGEGFTVSPQLSPNSNPFSSNPGAGHLQDVWTKGWTEVTFDLSLYRGQDVSLTFEADNCIPGGHFAYAYIALRNNCGGLQISGDSIACTNSTLIYSVPSLAGASYQWSVPSNWTVLSGAGSNIINVNAGSQGGLIVAHEINGCANLQDTFQVSTRPPTLPGTVSGDTTLCAGINAAPLILSGNRGNIVKWISSPDGVNWSDVPNSNPFYTARNLSSTTQFKALVQNSSACSIDSSTTALVNVDQKTVGGNLDPGITNICEGQTVSAFLNLKNFFGAISNWQSSIDGINWNNSNPTDTDSVYAVLGIISSTKYRTIVQNGVCPMDTSSVAQVNLIPVPFPQASMEPADTTICYGGVAQLNAVIGLGTTYTWTNENSLSGTGNGVVNETPFNIIVRASPQSTTTYVLSIQNAGCPNSLDDSFNVHVIGPIIVNAGNDTAVVVDQPLQLHASSNDSVPDQYSWVPATGLNDPSIANPVALLGSNIDSVRYLIKALSQGTECFGTTSILVRVFKTAPDIFVPNAFTPGKNINSIFRPIPVGISTLEYFRIFNRWGQLVYSSNRIGQGWDGNIDGNPQGSGSYVWMVKGTDYTGKVIVRKGTMVLIR